MKHTRPIVLVLLLLAAVLVLAGCGSGAPKVDWTLKISGAVDKPLSLSFADLAKMPQVELKDVLMQKSQGPDETTSWSGVSLDEILRQAGVNPNYTSIMTTAADGYALEVTRDELTGAIVALKDQTGWITVTDKDHGPIRLVCPQAPANRWVFQLTELSVVAP